jgi:phytanoyl-CoA hydroxylase
MSVSFLPNQTQEIQTYYEEYGYVVVRDIISNEKIAALTESYETLKASRNYYFWSQDTNRVEKLAVNKQGFIEHSILQPIELVFQQTFRESTLNIVASAAISQLLNVLSGQEKHIIWQTMFFDKSTGTVAHQDHYYLDSDPPGNLVACWFALENIHKDAGPFFVIPKSHKGCLIDRNYDVTEFSDHSEYVKKIEKLIDEKGYFPQPMLLEKGSVLFWHPFLIHGAFQNINPEYSRKSLTAHYLPQGYGRLGQSFYPTTASLANPNILVWKKSMLDSVKASVRHLRFWAMFNLRPKNKPSAMEMRSSQYQGS